MNDIGKAGECRKETELEEVLRLQKEALETLEGTINVLVGRLEPVLQDTKPDCEQDSRSYTTSLTKELNNRNIEVETLTRRIRDILDRLVM